MSYETRYAAIKRTLSDRRSETPEALVWRQRDARAREQATRERDERFPEITRTSFKEASKWFEARVAELMEASAQ